MFSFITLIHVVVAIILMISVLLQTGKGTGLGAAFGGSSSSVFGARGPATFIGRVTTVAAIIFMVTSLTLSVFAEGAYKRGSVIEAEPEPAPVAAPVEGRAVSEEEVQVPIDPTLLPAPGLEESATEASEISTETTPPAAGSDSPTSDGAGKGSEVSGPAQGGQTSPGETATEQSSSGQTTAEQSSTEQNAAGQTAGDQSSSGQTSAD
ncbi:MAG: preprotein translocase subunit SecG [Deltaproteobacteria bacterium]|jgi:preprotein translocase subunit SecG|nr:preprotein translocase subunit SecG [Deltaproteobacteria bacterium]